MKHISIKEKRVSRLHISIDGALALRDRDSLYRIALIRVSLLWADKIHIVCIGNDHQAAIFRITVIQRSPRCATSARLNQEIIIILVNSLTTCTRWLKIIHALSGHRILPHEPLQVRGDLRMC